MPFPYTFNNPFKKYFKQNISSAEITKKIHDSSTFFSVVATGMRNLFLLLSSIFRTNKNLSIIAFVLRISIQVSNTLEIITNPKKTQFERIKALAFLAFISSLLVVAFLMGPLAAASTALGLSILSAASDAKTWFSHFKKNKAIHDAYADQKEFDALMETHFKGPNHDLAPKLRMNQDVLNRLLEIRFIELDYLLEHPNAPETVKKKYRLEKAFILQLLQEKNITPGIQGDTLTLMECYKERRELRKKIAELISVDNGEGNKSAIAALQEQIDLISTKIKKIAPTTQELHRISGASKQKLALSTTTLLIDLASIALAGISLALTLGTLHLAPIAIGLGIAIAAVSLMHFVIEKIITYSNAKAENHSATKSLEDIIQNCDLQATQLKEEACTKAKATTSPESKVTAPDLSKNKKSIYSYLTSGCSFFSNSRPSTEQLPPASNSHQPVAAA